MKISPINTPYHVKFKIKNNIKQNSNKNIINKISAPYNIAFGSAIPIDDNYFFNIDDSIDFKIDFNKFINHKLNLYKTSSDAKDSVYLKDKKTDKIKSKKNVTLLGNSFANTIISDLADIHNNSEADKIKSKNLYLFDSSKANEANTESIIIDDDSNISYAKTNIAWLIEKGFANQINTNKLYQRNNTKAGEVVAQKVYIRDKAQIDKVQASEIILKDSAKIKKAFVENGTIKLSDNSFIENLNPENSKILIGKDAKIQMITSDSNIDITGQGTIGDIYTNAESVIIRGPIKLEGKIVFANKKGGVIVQKAPYNIYPKLKNENVENGILEFLMINDKETIIGNPTEIFEDGIQIAEKIIPQEQSDKTSVLSDLSYLTKYYKSSNPELSAKIKSVINSKNGDIARTLFNDFYNSTLKTFNSCNGEKTFSVNFVNNAMLGEESLADFWISVIGKKTKNDVEKTDILNNLSTEDKRKITNATIEYWIDNIFPQQTNTANHNNIETLQENIDFIQKFIDTLVKQPEKAINDIDNNIFYKKLTNTEINQNKLIDLWINPYKTTKIKSERLIKEYLKATLKNPASRREIILKTKENLETAQNFLNNYKDSCQDIIDNETGLSKTEKNILKKFRNDENLYNYTFNKTEDKNNKPEIETVILSLISEISKEYEELSLNAQKNIFKQVLLIPDLIKSDKNSQLHNYVNFILTEYGQMIALQDPIDAQDNKEQLSVFKNHVENNSLFFENLWRNIVNSSFQFYIAKTLTDINANNIKMLSSISKNQPQNEPLNTLINGRYIDLIEQKDFIARYQYDPNFVTLMSNDGINKKEVVANLLMTETVNETIYQQRIKRFNEDISAESVMENLDIAEKYLKIMDMDSSSMTLRQKVKTISEIPQEELSMLNTIVVSDWRKNELAKFMSDKFVSTQLEYNINAQGRNIRDLLSQMCEYLNSININIQGQNYTLYELTQNIDKMAKLSEKSFKELYFIGQNIEAINGNTESMKSNIKAILYSVMQNSKIKDPELSSSIKNLLPENERGSLTEFISKVNIKCKEIKDEKRKAQLKSLANLVLIAVGATGFESLGGDMLGKIFGSGETMTKITTALCGIAKTVKHVSILKAATTGIRRD